METSGNKGEWSELYVLFKLLADKELSAGDADLNKIQSLIYPIISIIRYDIDTKVQYNYDNDERNVIIKNADGTLINSIPVKDFAEKAEYLLKRIKEGKGAFEIPEIIDFREKSEAKAIKAPSKQKADITIIVHDERTGTDPELSFSVKSQLGNPATLLNASAATNFIFKLGDNLDAETVASINNTESESKRLKAIEKRTTLSFTGIQESSKSGDMFYCNLQNIDTSMPDILAYMLLLAQRMNTPVIKDIIAEMSRQNPLHFNMEHNHTYYETKIKRLLVDVALGMTPTTLWNGKYEANGGYLVVKQDGDIVCYHIYNKNEFEDYLYNNVKLEYASRSRWGYGDVFVRDDKQYLKLNLQIRFIK